jgi:hypothetical protein
MRENFVKNKWEYEIHDLMTRGQYGFRLDMFKNGELVYSQAGFGCIQSAESKGRNLFILFEFGIDLELIREND